MDATVDVSIIRTPAAANLVGLKHHWLRAASHGRERSPEAAEAFRKIRGAVEPEEMCPTLGLCGCDDEGRGCFR